MQEPSTYRQGDDVVCGRLDAYRMVVPMQMRFVGLQASSLQPVRSAVVRDDGTGVRGRCRRVPLFCEIHRSREVERKSCRVNARNRRIESEMADLPRT
jgi:hypothetical protein